MNTLIICGFVVSATTLASADSKFAGDECGGFQGDPIVTIVHGAATGSKLPTSRTNLYPGGTYQFTDTTASTSKPGRVASGCLGKDELAKLTDAIKSVPWTITHPYAHCMAMALTFTTYTISKTSFTSKVCGNDILDDKSAAVLAQITNLLDTKTADPSAKPAKP